MKDDWRIRDDADTLLRAAEIQSDSKRMAAAHKHLTNKVAKIQKVTKNKPVSKPTPRGGKRK